MYTHLLICGPVSWQVNTSLAYKICIKAQRLSDYKLRFSQYRSPLYYTVSVITYQCGFQGYSEYFEPLYFFSISCCSVVSCFVLAQNRDWKLCQARSTAGNVPAALFSFRRTSSFLSFYFSFFYFLVSYQPTRHAKTQTEPSTQHSRRHPSCIVLLQKNQFIVWKKLGGYSFL